MDLVSDDVGNSVVSGYLISEFSQDIINQMPENPQRKSGHRRVHSEIITLPDDLCFVSELGIVHGMDGPLFSVEAVSMYHDGHGAVTVAVPGLSGGSNQMKGTDKLTIRHQHSQSVDGLSTMFMSGSEASDPMKAMSAANLAELALVDPKRAKRIWANRQSAARSKERKMRYISELERKIQALKTETTSLTAQLNLLQRDTSGLIVENNELKAGLQTMEQQIMLQDAVNASLREEIQHLKAVTGQSMSNGGPVMNFPYEANRYYPNNQAIHTLMAAQQFPDLHIHPHNHLHQFQQLQRQRRDQQPQQELHWQPNDVALTGSISSQPHTQSDSDTKPQGDDNSIPPSSS